MKKTVLITGSSSGFGKLAAKKFQSNGWNVIATMRSPEKETELQNLENVLVTELDVTKTETIHSAVHAGIEKFGKIDLLVNNAGFGNFGVFEASSEELMRSIFEVNVFGLMNTTKAILPHFRSLKNGHIINVSSIVGRVGFPMQALYHSTKFAVEGFTESIRHELDAIGVKISLVEPGGYLTHFIDNIAQSDASHMPEYNKISQKYFSGLEAMMGQLKDKDPKEVSDIIYEVATDESAAFRNPVGSDSVELSQARKNLDDESMYQTMKGIFNL